MKLIENMIEMLKAEQNEHIQALDYKCVLTAPVLNITRMQ